ncbi:DUF397 domain-containing protein [Streptomyces sp. NPDC019443]|uniref:DUF397 domain-containing protein n=1 Tax=Streptomyces sp. NPDC019443 TaxID=3365061 RepID=UPI0037AC49C3
MNTEVSASGTAELGWFKSSYSGGEGGECVEVAVETSTVHIRDSKDIRRPYLSIRAAGWAAFLGFAAGR